jgi:alanyl-tRNA synthetase
MLAQLADQIAAQAGETIILLAGTQGEEAAFACKVPGAVVKQGLKAGEIIKIACTAAGGGGGGKPQFAQGAGKSAAVAEAFAAARRFLSG